MSSAAQNALLEFVTRYGPAAGEEGPLRLVREVFGAEPDEWQEETLRAFGRGERRMAIRSCHGPGKTATAAWLVWVMLLTRFPQKTVATAPSRSQLEDALVSEVNRWFTKLPPVLQPLYEMKKNRVELRAAPDESFFSARTAREESPEALQGVHSENVLLIADEASGVPEKIYEAAVGSMSGHNATTLLLGNPVRSTGYFFQAFNQNADMWWRMHVTGVPGTPGHYSPRVSADFVEQVRRTYGENSNAFRVRALGEFPLGDQDTIIPFDLIESARARDIVTRPDMREVWGVDVARFGDDANVLVRRNRLAVLPKIMSWEGVDLMQTAGIVKAEYDACEPSRRPDEILVDVIGLGAGVVDRLRELGLPARGVNVSETASMEESYRNLRTELWFRTRDWLNSRDKALPRVCTCGKCDDMTNHAERLAYELALLRFGYTSTGKMQAEPKSEVKKRGHKSPNVADALVLTFAGEPASLIHGSNDKTWGGANWNQPLKRGIQLV